MRSPSSLPAALNTWIEVGLILAEAAGAGAVKALRDLRPRRQGSYLTRRPGAETPCWNLVAGLVKAELTPPGSKVRLARYLGIPRQRLHDFLTSRRRMPDAELTLQLLYWLVQKRAGRDLSL